MSNMYNSDTFKDKVSEVSRMYKDLIPSMKSYGDYFIKNIVKPLQEINSYYNKDLTINDVKLCSRLLNSRNFSYYGFEDLEDMILLVYVDCYEYTDNHSIPILSTKELKDLELGVNEYCTKIIGDKYKAKQLKQEETERSEKKLLKELMGKYKDYI